MAAVAHGRRRPQGVGRQRRAGCRGLAPCPAPQRCRPQRGPSRPPALLRVSVRAAVLSIVRTADSCASNTWQRVSKVAMAGSGNCTSMGSAGCAGRWQRSIRWPRRTRAAPGAARGRADPMAERRGLLDPAGPVRASARPPWPARARPRARGPRAEPAPRCSQAAAHSKRHPGQHRTQQGVRQPLTDTRTRRPDARCGPAAAPSHVAATAVTR